MTLSSCEVEYVSLCSAVCEVKYLRALLYDLAYPQDEATLIWGDNKAAIVKILAEANLGLASADSRNMADMFGQSKEHLNLEFQIGKQATTKQPGC